LVYTSVDGHLVPWCIIGSVIRVSALTWFIRYIYYWNFSSNAILIKTNFNFDQTAIMFRSFGVVAPKELWIIWLPYISGCECTWRRLFQKGIIYIKVDMYMFITINISIPLLMDFYFSSQGYHPHSSL
jgi:hypothetical protein